MSLLSPPSSTGAPPENAPALAPAPPSEASLLVLIHRVSSAGRALRRLLAEHATAVGLNDADVLVVWLCSPRGMVQGDLATAIGVSPALMSGTVERLRQQGLIEMHRVPVDRRRQVWRTTDQGQHVLSSLRPLLVELAQQVESRLPAAELAQARDLCERLTTAAHEIAELPAHSIPAKGRVAA